jgi:Ca-activated chloride channel family protein
MRKRILVISLLAFSAVLLLGAFVAQPSLPPSIAAKPLRFIVHPAVANAAEPIAAPGAVNAGSLQMVAKTGGIVGVCPLKHTDVQAGISGFIARVSVTQEFVNPSGDAIEAVYTFPLPHDSAVDDMTITVGGRTIHGDIKRREEAQQIYTQAIQQGRTAALLNQQRPNIFVQRVGNIAAGESVRVQIAFSSRLKYEDGTYEFTFPMVVAPRYVPGKPAGANGGGFSPDTNTVPDGSQITPMPVPPGMRAGHDISMSVMLDAGVPIQDVTSVLHKIDVERPGSTSAIVRLKNQAEIPNRDFILRYKVAGPQISEGIVTHVRKPGDGYFSLVLQPPDRFPEYDITPKELVFLLDTSGSMSGFPIETGKRLISTALDELYPGDTFNLITFSGDTSILFPEPVYPTAENIAKAKSFLGSQRGYGGTEMMKAIRAALAPSDASDHMRVVCFVTDGEVGNDMEIIHEVQQHPNARVFSFGIGNSVNRFLLEKVAQEGRGEAQFVTLQENASEAAKQLYQHLRAPLLTDVVVDWGKLPVHDVYPARIPDVFAGRPVELTGRFSGPASGVVRVTGKRAGQPYEREIPVTLPAQGSENAVLASLWARSQIEDLMSQDWMGAQMGKMRPDLKQEVTKLGLDYRLLTQFTSFVAVEDRVVNVNGAPKTVQVPVEMPQGMDYNGVFGGNRDRLDQYARLQNGVALGGIAPVPNAGPVAKLAVPGTTVTVNGQPPTVMSSTSQTVTIEAATPPLQTMQPSLNGPPVSVNPNQPQVGGGGTGGGYGSGVAGGVGAGVIRTELEGKPPKLPEVHVRPIERKLHPALVAAYDCWEALHNGASKPSNCSVAKAGDVITVELVLTSDTPEARKALLAAGVKLHHGNVRHNVVRGTIAVANLAKLAELNFVRFAGPAPTELAKK